MKSKKPQGYSNEAARTPNRNNIILEEESGNEDVRQESGQINMVTTNLPVNLTDDIEKFCKLYKSRQYKEFSDHITHVIVYPQHDRDTVIQAKRTLKYLHGLIQGCWIVSYRCEQRSFTLLTSDVHRGFGFHRKEPSAT